MGNDTDSSASGSIHDRGRMTRSATHALSKKVHLSTSPNRKSDRLEKMSPPSSSQSPLRRSERTKQHSPSDPNSRISGSNKLETAKESSIEADAGASWNRKVRRRDARSYRATLEKPRRGCCEESSSKDTSTLDGDVQNEGKVDECLTENRLDSGEDDKGILPSGDAKAKEMRAESGSSGHVKELLENNVAPSLSVLSNGTPHETSGAPERVQSDCCGEKTPQMLRDSKSNENLIRKCDGHDKDEKLTFLKRKRTAVDMDSDVSATLADDDNCNMDVDAAPSRLCDNIVETSGSCSKRIRRISLSDVQKDKELTNNVDQPSSKSNDEKLSTRNKEERPQGNNVETEKFEKIRKEQRSLHLLLKPQIAKLCEILLLPDNVKIMVENCLEYTLNNYQICDCTTPVSLLQAFQLSLCWTVASLLDHKFDSEASLMLAKRHLRFDCDKDVVIEIKSMLSKLENKFLLLGGNCNASGSRKVSGSSNRVDSHTEVMPEVELVAEDISKNIRRIENTKNQWGKLLQMQQEEECQLKKDIENEKAEFERRRKIEWILRSHSYDYATIEENYKLFSSEYDRRVGELNRHHEIRVKDLEAKHLEARQKFRESCAPDELLNLVAPKKLETRVENLHTGDEAQPHNAPKALSSDDVAKEKCSDNIAEAMTTDGTGVGFSEALDTNSSLEVSCSSPVELQTQVKHSGAEEVDGMATEDGPVSRSKCHNIAENEYVGHENVVSRNSNSKEQCLDGATNIADKGREDFGHTSHNDFGRDTVMCVRPSSDEETRDGETSDVPSGEVALAVHETRSSNDDQLEAPFSRQEKLEGTILSEPICGLSIEVKANGFSDVKNMASISQSPEEHIPTANTTCTPNCDNAAQILEADDSNGSNNADAIDSPLSNERISSLNSKSPQENFQSVDVTCMPTWKNSVQIHEDADGNGSNNVVTPTSPLVDERIVDGTTVSVSDTGVHGGMSGFTPSTEQISGVAVNASVFDSVLSRPCRADNTSNSPDANAIVIISNQSSLDQDNLNGVSSSMPAGQIPVEVSETNHEGATVSVLDRGRAVGNSACTDYPENASPLNSPLKDQISDGGSVLGGDLSPRPSCATSPSNGQPATSSLLNSPLRLQNPDRDLLNVCSSQIPVIVPENSQEEAAHQLTDGVVADKTTTSDQHEGMCITMTGNTLSQENPVSKPDDLRESPGQVQPPSSVESPVDQDTSRDMQNSPVSSQVHLVPGDQSNHVSTVIEPPEQEQQQPSEGFPSSNQDLSNLSLVNGVEDCPTNEEALSGHIPKASPQVQSQAAEQPASNLELGSNSCQAVHPASNSDLDSHVPGGVRTQSLDTRSWSTPAEINNHAVRIATRLPSGMAPPFCHDPFLLELEKIRRLTEENMKKHDYTKLKLKGDYEKEFEELRRKYENKLQENEVEFQKTVKDLERHQNIVNVNKLLADAFRKISTDLKVPGASGMLQDSTYMQQLIQLSVRRSASSSSYLPHPVLESSNASTSSRAMVPPIQATSYGPRAASLQNSYATTSSRATVPPIQATSYGPRAASLQNSYATTSTRTTVPPIQATYNTTGVFSSVSSRPVDVSNICSPSGNSQSGGEIRAAPPHLQHSKSSMLPPSNLCTVPNGTPSQPVSGNIPVNLPSFPHRLPGPTAQPAPRNFPVNSTLFPHRLPGPTTQHTPGKVPVNSPLNPHQLPRPRPTAFQSDPHRGHWPENANSQPGVNLPNVVSRTSDLTSLNQSKIGTSSSAPPNSTQQSTPDVVYLSDDE